MTNRAGHVGLNRWLQLRLEGRTANRQGIGTRITVTWRAGGDERRAVRVLSGGSNYLGQNEAIAHFGLGPVADRVAEVAIEWPGGSRQVIPEVAINQRTLLIEPPALR